MGEKRERRGKRRGGRNLIPSRVERPDKKGDRRVPDAEEEGGSELKTVFWVADWVSVSVWA